MEICVVHCTYHHTASLYIRNVDACSNNSTHDHPCSISPEKCMHIHKFTTNTSRFEGRTLRLRWTFVERNGYTCTHACLTPSFCTKFQQLFDANFNWILDFTGQFFDLQDDLESFENSSKRQSKSRQVYIQTMKRSFSPSCIYTSLSVWQTLLFLKAPARNTMHLPNIWPSSLSGQSRHGSRSIGCCCCRHRVDGGWVGPRGVPIGRAIFSVYEVGAERGTGKSYQVFQWVNCMRLICAPHGRGNPLDWKSNKPTTFFSTHFSR